MFSFFLLCSHVARCSVNGTVTEPSTGFSLTVTSPDGKTVPTGVNASPGSSPHTGSQASLIMSRSSSMTNMEPKPGQHSGMYYRPPDKVKAVAYGDIPARLIRRQSKLFDLLQVFVFVLFTWNLFLIFVCVCFPFFTLSLVVFAFLCALRVFTCLCREWYFTFTSSIT